MDERAALADRIAAVPTLCAEMVTGGFQEILRLEGVPGCYTNLNLADRKLILDALRCTRP